MKGLMIRDLTDTGYLAFDLKDILGVIGAAVQAALWRCTDLECTPVEWPTDGPIEQRYDTGTLLPGEELIELAKRTQQVVDGTFCAYRSAGDNTPWLVIRAVDSSFWEVFSSEESVLIRLRARFHDVQDIVEERCGT